MTVKDRFSLLIISAYLFILCSCKPRSLSKDRLVNYISHSKELDQTIESKGINMELRYVPYQLIALQEIESRKKEDSIDFKRIDDKYRSYYYFRLSFSKDKKEAIRQLESFQRYSEMLQVMSFRMGEFVNASSDKSDTIPLADYAFEQGFGMTSANNILLVFKRDYFAKSQNVEINVEEMGFDIGDTKFKFLRKDLDELPILTEYAVEN